MIFGSTTPFESKLQNESKIQKYENFSVSRLTLQQKLHESFAAGAKIYEILRLSDLKCTAVSAL